MKSYLTGPDVDSEGPRPKLPRFQPPSGDVLPHVYSLTLRNKTSYDDPGLDGTNKAYILWVFTIMQQVMETFLNITTRGNTTQYSIQRGTCVTSLYGVCKGSYST